MPGQMLYQLEPPNDDGKWFFTLTNKFAVSFERDDRNQVIALKMYQSGLTFEAVRLRAGELPAVTAFLDAETGDPLRFDLLMQEPRLKITIPMTIRNQDYRDVKGTRVAFRTVSRNEFSGERVFEVESVETHVTFDADHFTPPGD